MNPKPTITKTIIQALMLFALCIFANGAYANDGVNTAPPPTPAPTQPADSNAATLPLNGLRREEEEQGDEALGDNNSVQGETGFLPVKTTREVMDLPTGLVVQVTAQSGDNVSVSLVFVPGVKFTDGVFTLI